MKKRLRFSFLPFFIFLPFSVYAADNPAPSIGGGGKGWPSLLSPYIISVAKIGACIVFETITRQPSSLNPQTMQYGLEKQRQQQNTPPTIAVTPKSRAMVIGGTNVHDQFLKKGEIFDSITGKVYRNDDAPSAPSGSGAYNDAGSVGYATSTENHNVTVGVEKWGILNAVYDFGCYIFGPSKKERTREKEREASIQALTDKIEHGRLNPPSRETVGRADQHNLEKRIAKVKHYTDDNLILREKNLQGWKKIQERAVRSYDAHIAAGREDLIKAKASAEKQIVGFERELTAIQQERDARLMKQAITLTATHMVLSTQTAKAAAATTIQAEVVSTRDRDVLQGTLTLQKQENPQPQIDNNPNDGNQTPGNGGDKDPKKKGPGIEDVTGIGLASEIADQAKKQLTSHHPEPMHTQPLTTSQQKRPKQSLQRAQNPSPNPREQGTKLVYPENQDQLKHLFRDEGGHIVQKTERAERLLQQTYETGTYHGQDATGNHRYSMVNPEDGNQLWIYVRDNGKVQNCGINDIVFPTDPITGFLVQPEGYRKPEKGILLSLGLGTILAGIQSNAKTEIGLSSERIAQIQNSLPPAPISHTAEESRVRDNLSQALRSLPPASLDQHPLDVLPEAPKKHYPIIPLPDPPRDKRPFTDIVKSSEVQKLVAAQSERIRNQSSEQIMKNAFSKPTPMVGPSLLPETTFKTPGLPMSISTSQRTSTSSQPMVKSTPITVPSVPSTTTIAHTPTSWKSTTTIGSGKNTPTVSSSRSSSTPTRVTPTYSAPPASTGSRGYHGAPPSGFKRN